MNKRTRHNFVLTDLSIRRALVEFFIPLGLGIRRDLQVGSFPIGSIDTQSPLLAVPICCANLDITLRRLRPSVCGRVPGYCHELLSDVI